MNNKLIAEQLLTLLCDAPDLPPLSDIYPDVEVHPDVPAAKMFQGGECSIYTLGNPDGYHLIVMIPTQYKIPKYLEAMTVTRLTKDGFHHFEPELKGVRDLQTVLDVNLMRKALQEWASTIPREAAEAIWTDSTAYACAMWYYKEHHQFVEVELKIKQMFDTFAAGEDNDTLH